MSPRTLARPTAGVAPLSRGRVAYGERPEQPARRSRPRPVLVIVALLAIASAIGSGLLSKLVFPLLSIDNDEPLYRLQAQVIAGGHLFPASPKPSCVVRAVARLGQFRSLRPQIHTTRAGLARAEPTAHRRICPESRAAGCGAGRGDVRAGRGGAWRLSGGGRGCSADGDLTVGGRPERAAAALPADPVAARGLRLGPGPRSAARLGPTR